MSVVYEVKCECGNELEVTSMKLDGGGDLYVAVESCENCWESAKQEERDET